MAPRRLTVIGLVLASVCAAGVVLAPSCSSDKPPQSAASNIESVKINGEWFQLELAIDNATRFKGLSGRTSIEADGGMLFVFPRASPQRFVMRDCFTDIDIIFLDPSGRITAMHHMPVEPPRDPETEPMDPARQIAPKYEDRLTKYPSKFAAQFVIELAGGTLERLDLSEGDKIDLDIDGLKARAK